MRTPLFSLWGFAFALGLDYSPELNLADCLSAALTRLVAAGALIDFHPELNVDQPLFSYHLWTRGEVTG